MRRNPKKGFYLSIRAKIVLGFILLSLISSHLVGLIIYEQIKAYENQKIREDVRRIAVIGASLIDGDLHQQLKPGDEHTDIYQRMLKKLRQLKKDSGLTYLYTFAPYNSKKPTFVLDTDESAERALIGEIYPYPYEAEMKEAFAGKPSYTRKVSTDEWGTFISGYGPIYNSSGKIVAIVGADYSIQQVTAMEQRLQFFLISGIIISLLFSIGIAFFISRRISQPFGKTIEDLTDGTRKLSVISDTVLSSSQDWVTGNAQMASAIGETSASLDHSISIIDQNSQRTWKATSLSSQTKTAADESSQGMKEMLDSMANIRKSSEQIAKIIKVIEEIAFQTNILALNAAVEATRAGEYGSGFAVVAEEVRVLAQKCSQAAKDTTAMIEDNLGLSENGVVIAEKLNEILSKITLHANQVNSLMDQIAAESSTQARGAAQINQALAQMETVIHQHSTTAEKGASASKELNAQTALMKSAIDQLILMVNGAKSKK